MKRRTIAITIGTAMLGAGSVSMGIGGSADARSPIATYGCPTAASIGDADIVYLGQYGGGGRDIPYSFKGGSHNTTVTKIVGKPKRPTYFVVSAYEPTVWDFSSIDPKLIVGVHGSGFYEQGVTGVPESKPVTLRHRAANNAEDQTALKDGCLDIQYKYKPEESSIIATQISAQTGRVPTYGLMSNQAPIFDLNFDGTSLPQPVLAPTPDPRSVRAENPLNVGGLQPGQKGLNQMVASGQLMPIEAGLAREWAMQGMLVPEGRMAAMNGGSPLMGMSAYVVMKSVDKLPEGLDGANLVTFVLPKGITAPTGMDTHSSFFRYVGMPVDWASLKSSQQRGRIYNAPTTGPAGDYLTPSTSNPMVRVDWDRSGASHAISIGGRPQQMGYGSGMPYPQIRTQAMYRPPVVPSVVPDSYDGKDEDLPIWPIMILGAFGFGVWHQRRRIHGLIQDVRRSQDELDAWENPEAEPVTFVSKTKTRDGRSVDARQTPAVHAGDSSDLSGQVMMLTSRIVDLTDDDATIAEVSRLRRDLTAAISKEWDGDIAVELEAVVKHCSTAAAEYVVMRARTEDSAAAAMEASLLDVTRNIRGKLRELTEQQGSRDAGSFATQQGFIRRRHGPSDLS